MMIKYDFFSPSDQISLKKNEKVKQVQSSVKLFSEEKDPEKQMKSYLNMLSVIEGFIVEERSKEVIFYVIDRIIGSKIYDFIPKSSKSIVTVIQTLRILPKLEILPKEVPPPIVLNLFSSSCLFSAQQKQLLQLSKNYFDHVFSNEYFSFQLEDYNLIEDLWTVICQPISEEVQNYILDIIKRFKSKSLQLDIQAFQKFYNLVQKESIAKSNSFFACKYICTLLSQFTLTFNDVYESFIEYEVPNSIETLFKFLTIEQSSEIIKMLIEINSEFFKWLCQICSKNPDLQEFSFQLIFEYIYNKKISVQTLNQFFPLKLWFNEYLRPLSSLTQILQLISERDPKMVNPLFPDLFKLMNTDYLKIFQFTFRMVNEKKIVTYEELSKCGYLQSFVINSPPEVLNDLFTKSNFEEATKEVFKKSTTKLKSQTFQATFNSNTRIDLCSHFLCEAPTVENIKFILVSDPSKYENAFQIIYRAFEDNEEVCNNFILAGGLQWLDNMSDSYYVILLSCLVKRKPYSEVDQYINSLPKDHKIFKLPTSEIEKIVYGMNKMKFRPIRVASLFHLLPTVETIDPYNAFVLGKTDYPSNGYDCPLIDQIGNRYIKPQFISMLLSKPYQIRRFCDNKYDHFPLFQFFTGIRSLDITRDFLGISFWIKFHQTNNTTFFTTNFFKLSYENNSIIILTNNNEIVQKDIPNSKWIHIFAYLESTLFGYKLILKINERLIELDKFNSSIVKFKFASIEYSGNGILFMGSAIRLYYIIINTKFTQKVYKKGPGFINPLNNELIITPYQKLYLSSIKKVSFPSNCYAVPYFGFPFHFISQKRLSDLFTILDNSRTEEQFNSLFHTLLYTNEITVNNTQIFWQRLIRSIKNNSINKKDYIHEAVKSVRRLKKDEWTLSSILFDNELWKCFDNETLVEILFEFHNINFSSIPGFDLFMTTVVLQNPESSRIIDIILKNSSSLQELFKYIISFLGIAHCIDGIDCINDDDLMQLFSAKSETKVQHTIIDSLIKFLNTDNVKYFIKNGLSFDTLCGYAITSAKPLSLHFLELITIIEKLNPGYIDVNEKLIVTVAPLASFPLVWEKILELQQINNKFAPLLLSLIWATTISIVSALSINEKFSFKISQYYEKGLFHIERIIPYLFQYKYCVFILNHWFPLIFNFPIIYGSSSDNFQINQSRLSNVSIDDRSTSNIAAYDFMIELVSSVLSSFGFETPKNSTINGNFVVNWLQESTFLTFITRILLNCGHNFNNLFPSLILSFPFFHQTRGGIFIPILLQNFLLSVDKGFPNMKCIIDYIIFCISQKIFLNREPQLLENLFIAMKKTNMKEKLGDEFLILFCGLFNRCSRNSHQKLSKVLYNNLLEFKNIIINSNSQLSLFYIIYLMKSKGMLEYNLFMKNISNQFNSPKDKNVLEMIENNSLDPHSQQYKDINEAFSNKCETFDRIYQSIANDINKSKFNSDISDMSSSIASYQYKSNKQSLISARDYKKKMQFLDSSFSLIEERMQWERFMTSIHDLAISESSFSPKCFHLSPRCLQFMAPQILTPSPYSPFIDKKKKNEYMAMNLAPVSSSLTFVSSHSKKNHTKSTNSLIQNPNSLIQNDSSLIHNTDSLNQSDGSLIRSTNLLIQSDTALIQESGKCEDQSNFYNFFLDSNENNENTKPDEKRKPKSFDDKMNQFRNEEMNQNNVKNCDKILYDQTFTNEPKIYVDQRKVSTYTPEVVTFSPPRNDMMALTPKGNNKIVSSKSFETLKDPKSSKKPKDSDLSDKLEDSDSSKNPEDSNSLEKPDNSNHSEKPDNSNISEKVVDSSSSEKLGNSSSSEKLDDSKTSQVDTRKEQKLESNLVSPNKANRCVRFNSTVNSISPPNFSDYESITISENALSRESSGIFSSLYNHECDAGNSNSSLQLSPEGKPSVKLAGIKTSSSVSFQQSTFISDVIWQYRHHIKNLFSQSKPRGISFLKLFEQVFGHNYTYISECQIVRHMTKIHSIIFVYDESMLILTYSRISKDKIELMEIIDEKSLHVFLESIFLGHWGETEIFASHIVLKIPISSLIRIKQQKRNEVIKTKNNQNEPVKKFDSFEFWSLVNGNFIIKVNQDDSYKFLEKLKAISEKITNCLPRELLLQNNSPEAALLAKNDKFGRSFVDISSYPFFPGAAERGKENKSNRFPNSDQTEEMLSSVLPFAYSSKQFSFNEQMFESIPANFYFTTEFFMNSFSVPGRRISFSTPNNYKINSSNEISPPSEFKLPNRKLSDEKVKNLSRKRTVSDSNRMSKRKSSNDFSPALRKLLKLRERLRNKEFLNEWILQHFPEETNGPTSIISNEFSSIGNSMRKPSLSDINANHFCQKLIREKNANSVIQFTTDGIKETHLLSIAIITHWSVHVEHENLLLSFCLSRNDKIIIQNPDHYFAFASSINVSNNGLFLSVDFLFGLTRIWRIKYSGIEPAQIEQISDFSWSSTPTSFLSGTHFICATKLETEVVLWEINTGTLHRILKFGTLINAIALDDEFGAIWIATANHGYYYSMNGQRLAEIDFEKSGLSISIMAACPMNYAEIDRVVVCGCDNGKILLALARIETKAIDIKFLPSLHKSRINRITFHPNRAFFLSEDVDGNVFIWSVGEKSVLPINCFESCAICRLGKPDRFCETCGRAICCNCLGNNKHKCLLCSAQNLFVKFIC